MTRYGVIRRQEGKYGAALLYMFGTLVACVLLAAMGHCIGLKIR